MDVQAIASRSRFPFISPVDLSYLLFRIVAGEQRSPHVITQSHEPEVSIRVFSLNFHCSAYSKRHGKQFVPERIGHNPLRRCTLKADRSQSLPPSVEFGFHRPAATRPVAFPALPIPTSRILDVTIARMTKCWSKTCYVGPTCSPLNASTRLLRPPLIHAARRGTIPWREQR